MRLAILGGTFNPVHIGHLALADDVRASLGYDRVLLVPANIPPHKDFAGGACAADRLAMLHLAADGSGFLRVEECEIERGGLSYTIDTIRHLEAKFAGMLDGRIGLVFGQDLAAGFPSWKESTLLAEKTDIIIAKRPGSGDCPFSFPFTPLENSLLSISSSAIRDGIARAKSWRYLVPDTVYRYIVEHNLYDYR
jgi:nicotinate-nucleotide adenylyltransferase